MKYKKNSRRESITHKNSEGMDEMPKKEISYNQDLQIDIFKERERKIREKLYFCFYKDGKPDAVKLANAFGFEIIEHKGLPVLLNGIITCDSNGNQMAINNNISKKKKRYTIIYLLSHYLLYYQNQDFYIQKYSDKEENLDAAYFARLLLIPGNVLLAFDGWNIKNKKVSEEDIRLWSNIYEVPYDVVNKRYEDLMNKNNLVKKLIPTIPKNTENK